jgi:hypothetical protein
MEKVYSVRLLDNEGEVIMASLQETLKDAKKRARYLLSDAYPFAAGTSHEDLQTSKVEIWKCGECVFDVMI